MKNSHMKATTIKVLMIVFILLIISLSIVGFYFAKNYLTEASIKNEDTSLVTYSVNKSTSATKKIQDDIAKYQPVADKASGVFASNQDYQSQILKDLKAYASVNGISIDSYEFNQSSGLGTKTSIKTSGSGKNNINITLNDSIQFTKLIKFIKAIETNAPKMQITELNISPITGSKDSVKVDPITIEIYSR